MLTRISIRDIILQSTGKFNRRYIYLTNSNPTDHSPLIYVNNQCYLNNQCCHEILSLIASISFKPILTKWNVHMSTQNYLLIACQQDQQ